MRRLPYHASDFGRGDDTVGNPHRTQICQFELFELILLLKLDKQAAGAVGRVGAGRRGVLVGVPEDQELAAGGEKNKYKKLRHECNKHNVMLNKLIRVKYIENN